MLSRDELLHASGYPDRIKDFGELVHILDGELRLITPTDPEGAGTESSFQDRSPSPSSGSGQFYQLAHDYIVPSLREWLTRMKKETRRGRAELLVADRAAVWGVRRDNRQLPSLRIWRRTQMHRCWRNYECVSPAAASVRSWPWRMRSHLWAGWKWISWSPRFPAPPPTKWIISSTPWAAPAMMPSERFMRRPPQARPTKTGDSKDGWPSWLCTLGTCRWRRICASSAPI